MLLSLKIVITKGAALGYTSLWFFGLIAIVIVAFFIFLNVEKKVDNPLIDFKLFENKPYTGATISNFLLNGVAGNINRSEYIRATRFRLYSIAGRILINYLFNHGVIDDSSW